MRTDDTRTTDELANIGLCDFDAFQRGEHHEMFRTLRNTGSGVHWTNEPDGSGSNRMPF